MEIAEWWTAPQAAKRLGIAPITVHRVIAAGRLRAVYTALGALVDPVSVEAYAATRRPARHRGEKVTSAV
jgi:predicted site-specific integrase-resolvase